MWETQKKIMMLQVNLQKKVEHSFYVQLYDSPVPGGSQSTWVLYASGSMSELGCRCGCRHTGAKPITLVLAANETQHRRSKVDFDWRVLAQSLFLLKREERGSIYHEACKNRRALLTTPYQVDQAATQSLMNWEICWFFFLLNYLGPKTQFIFKIRESKNFPQKSYLKQMFVPNLNINNNNNKTQETSSTTQKWILPHSFK